MTTRQRLGTGSTATATLSPKAEASPSRLLPLSWTDWFSHASTQQRLLALGLAHEQGVVYPHQLPPTTNGVKQTLAPAKPTEIAALLNRLLGGKADVLPAPSREPVHFFDADLDWTERLAVECAVSTPDVMALRAMSGDAKTRVLAEILLQFATRGKRVLLLTEKASASDELLQRLSGRSEILALRYLDTAEKAENLPAALRGLIPEEQRKAFIDGALSGARVNRDDAETACRTKGMQAPLWAELRTLAERSERLERERQALTNRIVNAALSIESDTSTPFAVRLGEFTTQFGEELRKVQQTLEVQQAALAKCEADIGERDARISRLEPGYQAKKNGRFWSLAYWTNLFNGGLIDEMEALLRDQEKGKTQKAELQSQIDPLQTQIRAMQEQFAQERQARIDAEIVACRRAWHVELQRVNADVCTLDASWSKLAAQLADAPGERTVVAVDCAFARWTERTKHDEERCAFARAWMDHVETTGPQLAAKLPSLANVIAVSRERWRNDVKIAAVVGMPMDVVVLDGIEKLNDPDLVKLAGLAQRCILIGNQPRLWQALGGDADAWPYSWRREDGRLICQMLPIAPEDMRYLECEPLSDASDIELCILHRPKSSPCLGQVIFGPNRGFAEAFAFVMREAQEFPLEPVARIACWTDEANAIERRYSDEPSADLVDLESGIRIGLIGTRVARIEFAKSAGYDRAKAEAWLLRHRPIRDCERTAVLS